MRKFSELSLYRKMLSMFLLIFSSIVLITIFLILPISIDRGAALASCLSFGVTLYAAVVAYLILDNWKIQHRATLTSDYFQKTFNQYIELKDSIVELQNFHDSWLENIYRNHGEIDKCEDGGLIKSIFEVRKNFKQLENKFYYYSLIFKDPIFKQKIDELSADLNNLLQPILDEYHDREGSIHNSEHLKNAKNLREQLPRILVTYDEDLIELMSAKIVLS